MNLFRLLKTIQRKQTNKQKKHLLVSTFTVEICNNEGPQTRETDIQVSLKTTAQQLNKHLSQRDTLYRCDKGFCLPDLFFAVHDGQMMDDK